MSPATGFLAAEVLVPGNATAPDWLVCVQPPAFPAPLVRALQKERAVSRCPSFCKKENLIVLDYFPSFNSLPGCEARSQIC